MILFICRDLIFVSRVQTACQQMHCDLTTVSSVGKGVERMELPESAVSQIFIDLKSASDIDSLQRLKSVAILQDPPVPITAFGPHVKVDLLKAAREVGFDRVWTQGQFHTSFTELL